MIIREIDAQIEYYELNPPAALTGLRVEAVDIEYDDFTVHDDTVNTVFEIACRRCGNTLFETYGLLDRGRLTPPITVYCSNCEDGNVIFDPNIHGYDAMEEGPRFDQIGQEVEIECEEADSPCHIFIRYEYPLDVLGEGEFPPGTEQDRYTFVTILACDPDTDELGELFEGDC
jgi:hypothetical protein